MMRLEVWPMNVVPSEPWQIEQALDAMARQEHWPTPVPAKVRRVLVEWFEAGWSSDAVLVALRSKPDNSWRPPRRDGEDLYAFVRNRLRSWYDNSPGADSVLARAKPPRAGQSFEQWYRINQRNREEARPRPRRQLSERGRAARDQAVRTTRRPTTPVDRITRVRQSQARIDAAMDRLGAPPATDAAPAQQTPSPLTAAYAGRRAVINQHPRVVPILRRLAAERRMPTEAERQVLRNAVQQAKQEGSLAELAAWGGEQNQMLEYLTAAVASDLPFEATLMAMDSVIGDTP